MSTKRKAISPEIVRVLQARLVSRDVPAILPSARPLGKDGTRHVREELQYMPPGRRTLIAGRGGKRRKVRVNVDAAFAAKLVRQFQDMVEAAQMGHGDRPYLDFNHDEYWAAGEVVSLFWKGEDPETGGLWMWVWWSAYGRAALERSAAWRVSPLLCVRTRSREVVGLGVNMGALVKSRASKGLKPAFQLLRRDAFFSPLALRSSLTGYGSDIQWMPPGCHDVFPANTTAKRPYRFEVDEAQFRRLRRGFEILFFGSESGREPFIDFGHCGVTQAGVVVDFYWGGDDPRGGGIRAVVLWTRLGLQAVRGRLFQRFSPRMLMSADGRSLSVIDWNMGGLVNRAAFQAIQPVIGRPIVPIKQLMGHVPPGGIHDPLPTPDDMAAPGLSSK